jgi:tRNA (cmo5U34)-methyltransferase
MATPFDFDDPSHVERYVRQGPPAFAPGHDGMLRMAGVLLAESVPEGGQILVVGAGGGLEIRHLAAMNTNWRFIGVDPAPAMLALARTVAGPAAGDRLTLIEGLVTDAPPGPFDAATCILVLGLIPDDGAKRATLDAIRQRLEPGAPFILVDQCLDRTQPDFQLRLRRYAAYALASGVDPETAETARQMIAGSTTIATAARDEALLAEAGFTNAETFYVGMAWRGWIAYA